MADRIEEIRKRRAEIDRSYGYKADEVERLQREMDALDAEDEQLMTETGRVALADDEPH